MSLPLEYPAGSPFPPPRLLAPQSACRISNPKGSGHARSASYGHVEVTR